MADGGCVITSSMSHVGLLLEALLESLFLECPMLCFVWRSSQTLSYSVYVRLNLLLTAANDVRFECDLVNQWLLTVVSAVVVV